jgi:hypothetical protein
MCFVSAPAGRPPLGRCVFVGGSMGGGSLSMDGRMGGIVAKEHMCVYCTVHTHNPHTHIHTNTTHTHTFNTTHTHSTQLPHTHTLQHNTQHPTGVKDEFESQGLAHVQLDGTHPKKKHKCLNNTFLIVSLISRTIVL